MASPTHRLRSTALIVLAGLALVGLGAAGFAQEHHEPAGHGADSAKHDGGHDGHGAHHTPSALEHVGDDTKIELFHSFWPHEIPLPKIFGFQITKFMVLELLAAALVIVCYLPLANQVRTGEPARGWVANTFEVLLTFVRDQIAKPNLGEDKADRYVPFLWTLFLFILFNNLLGMLPFLGSATASIYVTAGLAVVVFFAIHGSAIYQMGTEAPHGHDEHGHGHVDHAHGHADHGHGKHAHAAPTHPALVPMVGSWRYIKSMWPQIDLPFPAGLVIQLLVFLIEVIGVVVRNAVLAVRLFANMFAGHMVLATILLFIPMAANVHAALWGTITLSSVLGILALSLLELFVAFLQAYIFTFLTSLFLGMAITPQH